jgi:hypothetical protein
MKRTVHINDAADLARLTHDITLIACGQRVPQPRTRLDAFRRVAERTNLSPFSEAYLSMVERKIDEYEAAEQASWDRFAQSLCSN